MEPSGTFAWRHPDFFSACMLQMLVFRLVSHYVYQPGGHHNCNQRLLVLLVFYELGHLEMLK